MKAKARQDFRHFDSCQSQREQAECFDTEDSRCHNLGYEEKPFTDSIPQQGKASSLCHLLHITGNGVAASHSAAFAQALRSVSFLDLYRSLFTDLADEGPQSLYLN